MLEDKLCHKLFKSLSNELNPMVKQLRSVTHRQYYLREVVMSQADQQGADLDRKIVQLECSSVTQLYELRNM